jgi:Domain of unknown function (DUF397)
MSDNHVWRKSSYSGGQGGNCVEVGQSADGAAVRDTKRRDGVVLKFSADAWRRLTDTLKK